MSDSPERESGRARVIVDLAYGDSGKGTFVDYFVRRDGSDLVVRFNGGPQAAHNVVLPDGRHHTFSQFGSGGFVRDVRTLLSRFVVIEPYALLNEAAHLAGVGVADPLGGLIIDARCRVITPVQRVANILRERSRGAAAHGTCGVGFGECVADSLATPELAVRAGDFRSPGDLAARLRRAHEAKRDEIAPLRELADRDQARILDDPRWIELFVERASRIVSEAAIVDTEVADRTIRESRRPIFEGAQGVLLDEDFGFHPHTTWSRTTFTNAETLLDAAGFEGPHERIGVIRTYMTRHGAGPFVSQSLGGLPGLTEPHNRGDGPQGDFRVGVLDLVALRYAIDVCGRVDGLAITHLDRLPLLPRSVCQQYADADGPLSRLPMIDAADLHRRSALATRLQAMQPVPLAFPMARPGEFIRGIEDALGVPVRFVSMGPTYADKRVVDDQALRTDPPDW